MKTDAVIARLERFEGSIPHMYRCTGGEVTIGIGHAIFSAEEAGELKWQSGTDTYIAEDFAGVAAAPLGFIASYYANFSTSRMSQETIHQLAADDVARFTALLMDAFPNWDAYPERVQQALFDMGFNLGIGGLKKFTKMLAAVDAGDWETAARESHRKGIAEARNQETAELFRSALA